MDGLTLSWHIDGTKISLHTLSIDENINTKIYYMCIYGRFNVP